MNRLSNNKSKVLLVLMLVVALLLVTMAVQSVKAFHIVLCESLDAVESAGFLVKKAEVETMSQAELENLMIQYGSYAINGIQSINGISENVWLYKKFELENFENFIFDKVYLPEPSMEQMKENCEKILDIQKNIKEAKVQVAEDGSLLSVLRMGKASAGCYFENIEAICKE